MIFQNWAYRTLRVFRLNAKGKMPMTHVFDIIRRPDTRHALLLETWGGFNKGYAKWFEGEAEALTYLAKRLNKIVRPADATIGLGTLKDEQTRIELDEGHFRIVHSEREFGPALETFTHELMTKPFKTTTPKTYGSIIGYEEIGWNQNNNIGRILNVARTVDTNATMPELGAALICRISLCMEPSDVAKIADSLVDIESFIEPPRSVTPEEPGEERMFAGDFGKAFSMSANMMRKHKPITENTENTESAPKKVSEEVLTEEEKDAIHSTQYTSWGAWS